MVQYTSDKNTYSYQHVEYARLFSWNTSNLFFFKKGQFIFILTTNVLRYYYQYKQQSIRNFGKVLSLTTAILKFKTDCCIMKLAKLNCYCPKQPELISVATWSNNNFISYYKSKI